MGRLLLILFLLFVSNSAFAASARMTIETKEPSTSSVGNGIEVSARIFQDDSKTVPSVGEKAIFQVKNPRSGDKCDTAGNQTDSNGYLTGTCYATEQGSYSFFAHSVDKSDDSSELLLTFNQGSTPTPSPSPTPSISPTPTGPKTTTSAISDSSNDSNGSYRDKFDSEEPTPETVDATDEENQGQNNPLGYILGGLVLLGAAAAGFWYWKKKNTKPLKKINTSEDEITEELQQESSTPTDQT